MRALFCLITFALICGTFAQSNTTFCVSNGCIYDDAVGGSTVNQAKGSRYTPPCIKIAKGDTITFAMDFSIHPLRTGVVVGSTVAQFTDNDIIFWNDSGSTDSYVLTGDLAAIPFYCDNHYGSGMMGVVYVGNACEGAPTAAPATAPGTAAPTAPTGAPVKAPNSATTVTVGAAALIAGLAMF